MNGSVVIGAETISSSLSSCSCWAAERRDWVRAARSAARRSASSLPDSGFSVRMSFLEKRFG